MFCKLFLHLCLFEWVVSLCYCGCIDVNTILHSVKHIKVVCYYKVIHGKFLFQPDPINGVQFRPVKVDIHLGVIKIANDEIYHDFQSNNTESVIVGT